MGCAAARPSIATCRKKSVARCKTSGVCPRGTPPDTDGEIGESMTPEPHRSSTSAPDGLRVVSEHNGDYPDASFAAYDRLIG
jgi:hypothetical protein